MLVKNKKICPTCGNVFIKYNPRHNFCSRRCFRIFYNKNQLKEYKYPFYICSACGRKTKLDFHPKISYQKWADFLCPGCGYRPMG